MLLIRDKDECLVIENLTFMPLKTEKKSTFNCNINYMTKVFYIEIKLISLIVY